MQESKTFLVNLDSLDKIVMWSLNLMNAWGIETREQSRIHLILEEAFINIFTHGKCENTELSISLKREISHLIIVIEDVGVVFNVTEFQADPQIGKPAEKREAGGLGVFFMKELLDKVEYKRDGDKNITSFYKLL